MLNPGDRVLVAVSGGKDSLAVWDLLRELGYEADGLYIGLGIGEYSDRSHEITAEFAKQRGWPCVGSMSLTARRASAALYGPSRR